ncbi:MAG TPA: hypothetical protein VGT06_07375 [Candidatus Methylomirabilis sp.]|jgi:hypothetical protein|nr:hypothetical protein [Candidatus Methylomirabilis sp.]
MKLGVFLVIALTIVLLVMEVGAAGEIYREPLDQVWEEHMLTGTPAFYFDGKRRSSDIEPIRTEKGHGSPSFAERHIAVQDFRGTRFFGLLRGGGWSISGGLLGKVEGKPSRLELWVKDVQRSHPGLFDNYYRWKEEETYEFFLLERREGAARATILKKWIIEPSDVQWFIPKHVQESQRPEQIREQHEISDVRGFLKYLPASHEAEVTITGLTHPFVERIKVALK